VLVLPLIGFSGDYSIVQIDSHSSLPFVHFPQVAQRLLPKYEKVFGRKISDSTHYFIKFWKDGIIYTNIEVMGAVLGTIHDTLVAPTRGGFAEDLVQYLTTRTLDHIKEQLPGNETRPNSHVHIYPEKEEATMAELHRLWNIVFDKLGVESVNEAEKRLDELEHKEKTIGAMLELDRFFTDKREAAKALTDIQERVEATRAYCSLFDEAKAKGLVTVSDVKDLYIKQMEATRHHKSAQLREKEALVTTLLNLSPPDCEICNSKENRELKRLRDVVFAKLGAKSVNEAEKKLDELKADDGGGDKENEGNGGDAKEGLEQGRGGACAHAGSYDRGSKLSDGGGKTV